MRSVLAAAVVGCTITGLTLLLSPASAQAACSAKPVTCGSATTDSLGPTSSCIEDTFPTASYVFSGTAGQELQLVASDSSGYNIQVQVTNSSGQQIAYDCCKEPVQISVTLPATGQYFIAISFGNPHNSGAFTLTVSCSASTSPPTQCSYSSTLLVGQSLSGQLTANDAACGNSTGYAKAYKVPVNADDAFTIDYSATYPVYIEVAGPDSSGSFRKSSGTSLTTSCLSPATGNVTIYASSNTGSLVTGSFTLILTPLSQPSCGRLRAVRH